MTDKAKDDVRITTHDSRDRGVKIMSKHNEGTGVSHLSKREPGELQTTIEIGAGDTQPLGPDGRRKHS